MMRGARQRKDSNMLATPVSRKSETNPESKRKHSNNGVSIARVIKIPGIANLGASYFCIKLVRYTMLAWLPMYLAHAQGLSVSMAAYVSSLFDIGSVVGAVVSGIWGSDPAKRVQTINRLCFLTGGCIVLYSSLESPGLALNVCFMALSGFLVAGPDSLLGGAATADACEQSTEGLDALTAATGFVNGMGSVGAILSGSAPVWIFAEYGWSALFLASGAMAFLGGTAILPIAI
eukprot:g2273.t1